MHRFGIVTPKKKRCIRGKKMRWTAIKKSKKRMRIGIKKDAQAKNSNKMWWTTPLKSKKRRPIRVKKTGSTAIGC